MENTSWGSAYRFLVLDIDGTLLTSHAAVAPSTREALARARAHGMVITLATGRRHATARPVIDDLGIAVPVILQSGAMIFDPGTDEIIYTNPLPPTAIAAAVRIAVEEGVQPILYQSHPLDRQLLIGPAARDSAPMAEYLAERPGLLQRLPYDELCRAQGTLQIAVIDSLPVVRRVGARMRLAGCRTLISYSAGLDSYFLEIVHTTCSKGEALRHLAARLDYAMEEVVAVGDNYNDREMLEVAGLGVAMANAEPEIIAVADHVTRSNDDDGIAALVDSLLDSR